MSDMPEVVWVGYYPDDGYTGESFDADTFDDGHNRTHYTRTDTIDHYKQAVRDMVKVIDEMRYTIGREVKGKVMPKSQEMAYEVLKTHATLIEGLKDE